MPPWAEGLAQPRAVCARKCSQATSQVQGPSFLARLLPYTVQAADPAPTPAPAVPSRVQAPAQHGRCGSWDADRVRLLSPHLEPLLAGVAVTAMLVYRLPAGLLNPPGDGQQTPFTLPGPHLTPALPVLGPGAELRAEGAGHGGSTATPLW